MLEMVTRRQWGARLPECQSALPISGTKGIALHYSGTASDLGQPGAEVMQAHQNYHLGKGWCDIAYNFEGDDKGILYEGRGWGLRSAGQGTNEGNDDYYAACFQGADKEGRRDFTVAAANAFTDLMIEYKEKTGRWPDVKPHSHFVKTECPGDEIRAYIALEPWLINYKPWPVMLPKWWWTWNAWRLGEGQFKPFGPKNRSVRHLTNAPKLIPPWAWARAKAFDRARKEQV